MNLTDYRQEIDRIDDELIRLFCRRMEIAAQIGAYKTEHNLPIYQPEREEEKLRAVALAAGSEFAQDAQTLYDTIFALSRDYQSRFNSAQEVP